MQVTLVQCSPRLMGISYEKVSVFKWHKWFKVSSLVKVTNDSFYHSFHIKGIVHFEFVH
jgi:hypothetical protein